MRWTAGCAIAAVLVIAFTLIHPPWYKMDNKESRYGLSHAFVWSPPTAERFDGPSRTIGNRVVSGDSLIGSVHVDRERLVLELFAIAIVSGLALVIARRIDLKKKGPVPPP